MGQCAVILVAIMLVTGWWEGERVAQAGTWTLSAQVSESLWERFQTAGTPPALRAAGEAIRSGNLVSQFYLRRLYRPAWSDDTGILPQAEQLLKAIQDAEQDGLRPRDYHLARLEQLLKGVHHGEGQGSAPQATFLTDLDILLTDAMLSYGSHLLYGRANPQANVDSSQEQIDLLQVLQQAVETNSLQDAMLTLLPRDPGYTRLRQALAQYRQLAASGGWPNIPGGPLRLGEVSERVETLRTRLRLTGDLDASPGRTYDESVAQAVRTFQARHGLSVDGQVNAATLAALNVPVQTRLHQIVQNMERWRWQAQDFGQRHVLVNIPTYTLDIMDRGQSVMSMRVVVGKPSWPSPVLSSTMTNVILRPDWTVPPSIATKELLPILRANPGYLAQHNMRVAYVSKSGVKNVDPRSINWSRVSPQSFPYRIRQDPGPRNPLGTVKFMFPNRFQVYLHDTTARSLFAKSERALSHGCIRVEKPVDLAEYILRSEQQWSRERIQATMAQSQRVARTIPLSEPVPVHLVYRTAWVKEDGTVQFRPDVYGYDKQPSNSAS